MNEIGNLIHTRRKELNLTLEEVGDAVGVGKSTVRKWENGIIQNIGNDKLAKLADVLQIDPVNLVPCDGERKAEYDHPHTVEARSLAKGIDRMPKEQREAILNMMMGLYPGIFEKGTENDDT